MLQRIISTLIITTSLLLGIPHLAMARTLHPDGNELKAKCSAVINMLDKREYSQRDFNWCVGFVTGVLNAHTVHTAYLIKQKYNYTSMPPKDVLAEHFRNHYLFCLPSKLTLGEIIQNVMTFVNQHPKELSYHGAILVHAALIQKYPCQRTTNQDKDKDPEVDRMNRR